MKKMMLMAAVLGLVGTAGAASVTGKVNFKADVTNVCRVELGGAKTNFPAGGYTQDVSTSTISYDATKTTGLTASVDTNGITIQCTKGTPLNVMLTPSGGAAVPAQPAKTGNGGGVLKLTKAGANGGTLTGNYTFSMSMNNAGNGDLYSGSATYIVDQGQWNAPEGEYNGSLLVRLEYN